MKTPEQLKEAIAALGGEFELIRELGQGATAVVYLLRDHALDRDVAMKVIRATFAADEEALARLQREARLVAQLSHPNIVKLYGTHRLTDGSFALLMEHVPGRNLKELLREEGAFPVPRALRVLKDVASALAYAHRRRIVHRDVKPENIYIDEEVGAARLADFGVARPWDQDARLTLPGASLGTPAYMSPEQIDGLEVDGRSDVYSLGLVGYEMLLGHHPWEGENVFTIIYRQKNDELPMDLLGLGHYPALAETLEKALEKEPAARLESAMAFLE
ncbi:MAG: serine/threonine-protein kinase [Gemmatimonadota bacterium]